MPRSCFFIILFLSANCVFKAQNLQHIKVKKADSPFLFFQKFKANDTIWAKKNDVFYLLLSDSLKQQISIETQNGQLMRQDGDSLVLLKYLPGINYLHKFEFIESEENSQQKNARLKSKKEKLVLITLIDGASTLEKNKIKIVFRYKNNKSIFAEFNYIAN